MLQIFQRFVPRFALKAAQVPCRRLDRERLACLPCEVAPQIGPNNACQCVLRRPALHRTARFFVMTLKPTAHVDTAYVAKLRLLSQSQILSRSVNRLASALAPSSANGNAILGINHQRQRSPATG
jgi:hypothetical protein